jgi:hypothetical protein
MTAGAKAIILGPKSGLFDDGEYSGEWLLTLLTLRTTRVPVNACNS